MLGMPASETTRSTGRARGPRKASSVRQESARRLPADSQGLNRPVSVTAAGGAVSATQYMADETLVSDPAGVTRLNTADRFGNLLSVVEDPNSWYSGTLAGTLNYSTSYTYDVLNDLLAVSQGGSRSRSFTYDPLKRLLTAQNPESGTITYTYDNSGNLATKLDALSITTSLAYDGLNRVTGKTYSSSPTGVSYAYDSTVSNCNGLGRLISVTYGASVANDSCYDVMGRVTKSSQTTGATTYGPFAYSWDISGALASEQYPSGRTVTNSFDAAGRVIGLKGLFNSNPTAYASNIAYAAQGPLQSVLLGNGITENWLFATPQLQPTQVQAGSALTLTWGYGSNSTNNGNILSASIATVPPTGPPLNASQSFGYDRVNRLTAASEGGTWTRNYGYDEWGNGWVALNSILPLDPTTPTASSNFDANNRLNIDGAAYNAAGNQTAIAGFTNTYDAENRLLTSALNGVTTTYTYDGDGRRVQKATGGSTTTYVYDAAGQLAAEYNSVAPTAAPCGTCYLTEDHLGSTRMMTDASGALKSLHDYVPFGEEIQAGVGGRSSTYYPPGPLTINDTVAQKFTGKERAAETGLDYFGARYLSAAQGRFTGPDIPFGDQDASYPQSWNLYSYVRSNPLTFTDLTGEDCVYTSEYNSNGTVSVQRGDCSQNGGTFVNGTIDTDSLTVHNGALEFGYTDPNGTLNVRSMGLPAAPTYAGMFINEMAKRRESSNHTIAAFAGAQVLFAAIFSGTYAVPAAIAALTAAGEAGAVVFGRTANQVYHVFRHLQEEGVNIEAAKDAIVNDIAGKGPLPQGLTTGVVNVGGRVLTYNAYKLADGTINVGRITVK